MPKLALVIRHAAPETLAENYASALVELGFELRPLNVFETAPEFDRPDYQFAPPGLDEVDLIISLGGPQSANDCCPALVSERTVSCRCHVGGGSGIWGVPGGASSWPGPWAAR